MRGLSELGVVVVFCFSLTLMGCAGGVDVATAVAGDEDLAADIRDEGRVTVGPVAYVEDELEDEPAGQSVPLCVEPGEPATPTHQAMFDALNAYRLEHGLSPLIYSKRLEAAADDQVRDLWQRGFFAHVNPDGKNPGQRAVAAGFCHQYVGENLAAGQMTIANAMTAWKNSPGHNANMLEPDYVYVGVSHSVDPNGRHYWAQEFAYELP